MVLHPIVCSYLREGSGNKLAKWVFQTHCILHWMAWIIGNGSQNKIWVHYYWDLSNSILVSHCVYNWELAPCVTNWSVILAKHLHLFPKAFRWRRMAPKTTIQVGARTQETKELDSFCPQSTSEAAVLKCAVLELSSSLETSRECSQIHHSFLSMFHGGLSVMSCPKIAMHRPWRHTVSRQKHGWWVLWRVMKQMLPL